MSKLTTQFIAANQSAYTKASKVFAHIESRDYVAELIELGIMGSDVRVYATVYVAEQSGVNPHPSQRGETLVFKKDSAEYNRVKYLVDVATGAREARKAAKPVASKGRVTKQAREAAMLFLAEFEGATLADQIKAAVAVLKAL